MGLICLTLKGMLSYHSKWKSTSLGKAPNCPMIGFLKAKLPGEATENAIRQRYQQQADYRQRVMDAGLMDAAVRVALPTSGLSQGERKVLWYYLEDVDTKLEVFADLLTRAELFNNIINTRFLYKSFAVDKEKGFVFTTDKGHRVPLAALSSGEQHELVLAYALLFAVKSKSLILIDDHGQLGTAVEPLYLSGDA